MLRERYSIGPLLAQMRVKLRSRCQPACGLREVSPDRSAPRGDRRIDYEKNDVVCPQATSGNLQRNSGAIGLGYGPTTSMATVTCALIGKRAASAAGGQ